MFCKLFNWLINITLFNFIKGLEEGTTQIAHKSVQIGSKIVFNFPLEVTFRSTAPFGCLYLNKNDFFLRNFYLRAAIDY